MQARLPQKLAPFHKPSVTISLLFSSSSTSNLHSITQNSVFFLHHSRHIPDLRILHCHLITSGLINHPFPANRFVQYSLRSGISSSNPLYSSAIFNSLPNLDAFTWNSVIYAFIKLGSPDSSVAFYFRMRASNLPPDLYTFALLVKACRKFVEDDESMKQGKKAHGQVMKNGVLDFLVVKNSLLSFYCDLRLLSDARLLFEESCCLDLISWNAMVSGFGKGGDVKAARNLFDEMPSRNLVSWSAMIDGYVRSGDWAEALRLFDGLQYEDLGLDVITLVSVLKASGQSGAIRRGRWIHLYIERNNLAGNSGNVVLSTALIDMYCRCGRISSALAVFSRASDKDTAIWNAMIGGLAVHGHGRRALELYHQMMGEGMAPNESTYTVAISACTHAGLVDEGIAIFESMKARAMEPQREHYGCLADLMGRAGRIREAEELLLSMPMEARAEQWGALMSACKMYDDFDVGVRVGRRLIELEPGDAGRRVMLANVYADAGRWPEAMAVRREMEEKEVKKESGWSVIDVKEVKDDGLIWGGKWEQ